MKATLEFNLPEEAGAFEAASHATALACALWNIQEAIHKRIKYGPLDESVSRELEEVRQTLWDVCAGLDLERMIG